MERFDRIDQGHRAGQPPFRQRVERHDSLQVELKRDYPVAWRGAPAAYRVDVFLFVPRSFAVTPATMPKHRRLALENSLFRWLEDSSVAQELASSEDARSPLRRAERGVADITAGRGGVSRPRADDLRRAGGIARAFLRDASLDLARRIGELGDDEGEPGANDALVRAAIASFLDELERLLARFRALRTRTQHAAHALHPELVEAAYLVDEHVTARAEQTLARLLVELEDAVGLQDGRGGRAALERRARELLRGLVRERARSGFATVGSSPIDAERFAFKQGLLKKYTDRPLYLVTQVSSTEDGGSRLRHAIGAVAAGMAAAWAFVAQIATQRFAVASALTGLIFLAFIAAYILKDRMKDFLKEFLMRYLKSYVPDRSVEVLDASSRAPRVVARVAESVSFLDRGEVPEDVIAAREFGHTVEAGIVRDEEVIHFRRCVDFSATGGVAGHEVMREVQRIDVDELLERLDDPEQRFLHFDPERDRVVERDARKVYHLNFVFRIVPSSGGQPDTPRYARTRVVLTKRGIARVERPLALSTSDEIVQSVLAVERATSLRGIGR